MYGRNGLGSIFVWATGNGGGLYDYCSCDGYINSPYTISIGAVNNCGKKPWYSELCPGTIAVTFSSGNPNRDLQIVTTDLRDGCTTMHTGTSAAAPLAAGKCLFECSSKFLKKSFFCRLTSTILFFVSLLSRIQNTTNQILQAQNW